MATTVPISEHSAERLKDLAQRVGIAEDLLLEQAIDMLYALLGESNEELSQAWQSIGAPTLHAVWDNEADTVFDEWRTLYDVSKG